MKSKVSLINVVLGLILLLSLVACKATPTPTAPPPSPEKPSPTPPPTEVPTPVPTAAPVTLRYANWNVGTEEENNIQRQLVKAYNGSTSQRHH